MKPYATMPSPTCAVRYSGSTAATISEETSVNMLTRPSSTTVAPIRPAGTAARESGPAGRSRRETYNGEPFRTSGGRSHYSTVIALPRLSAGDR